MSVTMGESGKPLYQELGLLEAEYERVVSLMGWTVTRQQSAVKITNTVDLTDLTKYGYQGFPVLD